MPSTCSGAKPPAPEDEDALWGAAAAAAEQEAMLTVEETRQALQALEDRHAHGR